MKVLFDFQAFTIQRYGGISRGHAEVIRRLPDDIEFEIALRQSNNVYLKEYEILKDYVPIQKDFGSFLKGLAFPGKGRLYEWLSYKGLIDSSLSQNIRYSLSKIKSKDYDLFHPTYFNPYFLPEILKTNKPWVLTVHDLTSEKFSKRSTLLDRQIEWRKILVPRVPHFTVPSISTKKDLMEIYGVPENKITVIYWGANKIEPLPAQDNSYSPYILYVGARQGYKNFRMFVEGVSPFLKKHPNFEVKCTGSPFSKEEIDYLSLSGVEKRFFASFVSDKELNRLYQEAFCFVFPSLSEGFGIPIFEALSNNCPCLLYEGSCLPEIGGDGALYFRNSAELNIILEELYGYTDNKRGELTEKGQERIKMFSWETCADNYAQVYRKL